MSVAMWNWHSWPLDISSSVKLPVQRTQFRTRGYIWQPFWVLHFTSDLGHFILQVGGITDCLFGYFISHLILVTSSDKFGRYIWLRWTLHLQTWPAKMCLNNNIAYYMWQIWGLMIEISVAMSVAMWNCQSWPLDDSSNVKLAFLTTRCQQQCEIAILDN